MLFLDSGLSKQMHIGAIYQVGKMFAGTNKILELIRVLIGSYYISVSYL